MDYKYMQYSNINKKSLDWNDDNSQSISSVVCRTSNGELFYSHNYTVISNVVPVNYFLKYADLFLVLPYDGQLKPHTKSTLPRKLLRTIFLISSILFKKMFIKNSWRHTNCMKICIKIYTLLVVFVSPG